jgi:hypothetical protein|eukprot:SAG25_NODE_19_length_23408_cov_10.997040_28_plen_123_part_00
MRLCHGAASTPTWNGKPQHETCLPFCRLPPYLDTAPSACASPMAAASPSIRVAAAEPANRGALIGYCRIHLFAAHFSPLNTGAPQCRVRGSGRKLFGSQSLQQSHEHMREMRGGKHSVADPV